MMGYDKVGKNIVLGADMWRELSLTGSWIKDATILQWVECPSRLIGKRRFVVEVTGDSMEPTCLIGDYVVCEFHRHCQPNHWMVIMANFSDLPDRGECAIKRISESPDEWVFVSDNPVYEDIRVLKVDSSDEYPIYGTVIYNLTTGQEVR